MYEDTRSWLLSIDMFYLSRLSNQRHHAFALFTPGKPAARKKKYDVDPAFMTRLAVCNLGTCIIPHSIAAFLSQATILSALDPHDFHLAVRTRRTKGCHVHAQADKKSDRPVPCNNLGHVC
jgi:hypothetical protein